MPKSLAFKELSPGDKENYVEHVNRYNQYTLGQSHTSDALDGKPYRMTFLQIFSLALITSSEVRAAKRRGIEDKIKAEHAYGHLCGLIEFIRSLRDHYGADDVDLNTFPAFPKDLKDLIRQRRYFQKR